MFLDLAGVLPPGFENLTADQITDLLDDDTIAELLLLKEEQEWSAKYELFKHLFPDETYQVGEFKAWARHLYPRHMEFFRLGKDIKFRCFMAGNRVGKCRTYNDIVPHPDGTSSKIGDLFVRGEPFMVNAWDGQKIVPTEASAVIRKPPEQVVEVLLSNGETFTASLDHRVLTTSGWVFLSDALSSVPCLPATIGEPDPLTHGADDPHWSRIVRGFEDHYSGGSRRDGGQPLDALEIVRSFPTSPLDVPQHIPALWRSDDPARKGSDSLSLSAHRLSSPYAARRSLVRSAVFLFQAACRSARRTKGSHQEGRPLLPGLKSLLRSVGEGVLGQSETVALVAPGSMAVNHVVAYRSAGFHALYDMTVPGLANYIADGIVHHNTFSGGGYEMTCHLTGQYPDWWEGRRFHHPIRAWACGKTNETTRDIVQKTLVGDVVFAGARKVVDGSGVIPLDCIGMDPGQITWKQGVADLIDTIKIKHKTGQYSTLGLKSYQQGRGAFEGTAMHVIWDDEEPPMDVYGEQAIRLATTKGILMLTFTPLAGVSEVVQKFLPDDYDVIGG